ncbi:MAG: hypothetical protein KDB90_10145 [Planctomycetes bacterium]|nr:hypothetical protein [Planctomycetota bacterium]
MARWILLFVAGAVLYGAPLAAETITQYQDDVFLRDHETVRYRVDIDYGTGTTAQLNVAVRGFDCAPRVRILSSSFRELREVRDTDGDWTVEPSITANDSHDHYFVEVDAASAWHEGLFEVTVTVSADPANNPDADVSFVKYFYDYESGDPSDHHDCAAVAGANAWPLALLAFLGAGAIVVRRRRLRPARQRA